MPKVKSIPVLTLKKTQQVLYAMNSKTRYAETNSSFSSEILAQVKAANGVMTDCAMWVKPDSNVLNGRTQIELGKSSVFFDSKDGKVISIKKPFYMTWNKLVKKITKFVDTVQTNYQNDDLVQKRFIKYNGRIVKDNKI